MSAAGKLKWLFRRLLAMSPGEVLYRLGHKARQISCEKRYSSPLCLLDLPSPVLSEGEIGAIAGRVTDVLDFDNADCPREPWIFRCFDEIVDLRGCVRWHSCGKAEWDSSSFSWHISFRGRDEIGDVRKTFELNRMQFLPRLLLYARKAGDPDTHALAKSLFYDWLKGNPFLRGVNWASPMEAALRAWQWTVCSALTTDRAFRADLIKAAALSVSYVEDNFSAYSSANNHLILEAACSAVIGELLGLPKRGEKAKDCKAILSRELLRQFYADGTNREHALHYHAFVVDMWLQSNLVFRALGGAGLHDGLLQKALGHIEAMRLGGDFFVEYGDSDDAIILDPSGGIDNYYEYVLALGRRYFAGDAQSVWKGEAALCPPSAGTPDFFEESGYFVYRGIRLYILFDVAALGFGRLAAHGHADCLQLVAGFDGKPIFIDSGTYIYNVKKELRDYFRSTPAHNTLSFNGSSQSVMQGAFLWSGKAEVSQKSVSENDSEIRVSGAHDGYSPHIHHRELILEKESETLVIRDTFSEAFTLRFILHPDRTVRQIDDHIFEIDDGLVFFFSSGEISLEKAQVSFGFLSCAETSAFCIKSAANAVSVLSRSKAHIFYN